MSIMQIKDLRRYFETSVKFKEQVDAFQFQLDLIEIQLREIISSDDLDILPVDVQEHMIVPRVRALRYWKIQLDDYKDKHLSSLINAVKNVRNGELEVTLDEAKDYFITPDRLDEIQEAKAKAKKAAAETIKEVDEVDPLITAQVTDDEDDSTSDEDLDIVGISVTETPPPPKAKSDVDILADLIASQKG